MWLVRGVLGNQVLSFVGYLKDKMFTLYLIPPSSSAFCSRARPL